MNSKLETEMGGFLIEATFVWQDEAVKHESNGKRGRDVFVNMPQTVFSLVVTDENGKQVKDKKTLDEAKTFALETMREEVLENDPLKRFGEWR